jgi:hypothetical protein
MAGCRFRGTVSGVSTGTSLKTILQIVAASNHAVMIDEISVSFQGTSNTASPILVKVARNTSAGTMSALTLAKDPDDWGETMQTTAQHTATAEPTEGTVILEEYVHPQTGYTWQAPHGKAIKIGGGDRLGISVTAGASVSCAVRCTGEE